MQVAGARSRWRSDATVTSGRALPGTSAARGLALFLGLFTLVSLAGMLRGSPLNANLWWADLSELSRPLAAALYAITGGLLVAWAVRPSMHPIRRWVTAAAVGALVVVTVLDGVEFYRVWAAGSIRPSMPVPLSFVIALLLVAIGVLVLRSGAARRATEPADAASPLPSPRIGSARRFAPAIVVVLTAALCALLFPLAQILFFGTTDYRRPADAEVVLGARVYSNGSLSPLLRDRVEMGVELYRQGLVPVLIMSGGVDSTGLSEPVAMRRFAVAAGVPESAILLDEQGVSTEATATNVTALARSRGITRLLAVSQPYHLPRIKLAFQSEGLDVRTVPAVDEEPIVQLPLYIAREVPGFWAYYLRAIS